MIERMPSITDEDINKIHAATMKVLRDVGVAFYEPEALELLAAHGAKVVGDRVFFTEKHVRQALEKVPNEFTVRARNQEKNIKIGGENVVFAPGYGAPFIITETGGRRNAILNDYDNFCKLVQTSKHIDANGFMMVEPSDLSPLTAHLDMLYSNITLCNKVFMGSSGSREAALDAIEMAKIVWGHLDQAVMISLISSLAPLQFTQEMTGAIIEFARAGQPMIIMGGGMLGSTSPITKAGFLVLQNSVVLAGICLTQFINPGSPVIYGLGGAPMDMQTGAFSIGGPEVSILIHAASPIARFYGIPSRGGGALTDAYVPDIQAGMESSLSLNTAVRCGINFILHSCGIVGTYIAMSYEKFLTDEELCGQICTILKPIDFSEEEIDLQSIKSVGVGGQYLTHTKTLERCRTEFYIPGLRNRNNYSEWEKNGKPRLEQTANKEVSQRLHQYEKPEIDPEIEKALSRYVSKRKHELGE